MLRRDAVAAFRLVEQNIDLELDMASHVNLVDMNYVRMTQEKVRKRGAPNAEINFAALNGRLARIRVELDDPLPDVEHSIAVMALDFANERQESLARAVEAAGFFVQRVDYRHAYVSTTLEEVDKAPLSLSHWIAYMC